ncbi:MAG: TetR family transcriptional regulator [Phycisphaeraceae bacterium]|nr:MAG: TetR family transcriptional regulator [Phycisphaeraceae bacterium]
MAPDTREKILQTAARLFLEQGFSATGVSTICREAGVNSGSLYHFFESKDALLVGVLNWYEEHLDPIVMGPIEHAQPDPVERIFALLAWYRGNMVATECRLGCPIGNLALEVSDTHPQVRPHIDINFANWSARIEAWLNEAGDRLPADLDRRGLSKFVLTVMEGGLMQARASDELGPFDDSVAQLRAYIDALLERARPTGTTQRTEETSA